MVDDVLMEKKTRQKILDVAQRLVRQRGYSAFSYADIAAQVGIRKASIHYHFPAKDVLVQQLVQRYRERMTRTCDRITRSTPNPKQQLLDFVQLYRVGLLDQQLCLCGMLTADLAVLSDPARAELQQFFDHTETWLATVLQQGCESRVWQCSPAVATDAKAIIALLQGAQLLARSAADPEATFNQVADLSRFVHLI